MLPAADAEEVRLIEDGLIEDDGSVRSPRTTTRAVRELDQ
jgi:hypothetical protein